MRHSDLLRLHLMGASHRELFLVANDSDFESAANRLRALRPNFPFNDSADRFEAARKTLSETGVSIVSVFDKEYPSEFLKLRRHPFLLYVKGSLPVSASAISVVWSRKPSPYGISVVRSFVSDFVGHGAAVVSWWAYGIDAEAHCSAMKSQGTTYAFVGTGIDVDYPRSHASLFREIAESWGWVISAFAPWSGPQPYHFPIRNALVAAYSAGTLVVEAAKNSGSLITAKLALDFGKEVFSVPGDVFRPGSEGTNALIRDSSAKCVLSASDVFDELPEFLEPLRSVGSEKLENTPKNALDRAILNELSVRGSANAEDISRFLGTGLPQILSRLSSLEVGGKIGSDFSGAYFPKAPSLSVGKTSGTKTPRQESAFE